MARKNRHLSCLPQLYKSYFKVGESMSIEKNREPWLKARERNLKKLKN